MVGLHRHTGAIIYKGKVMDKGQRTKDNGQWTKDNGQWTMDNGQGTRDNVQGMDDFLRKSNTFFLETCICQKKVVTLHAFCGLNENNRLYI